MSIRTENNQLLHVGREPAILDMDSKLKSLPECFNSFKLRCLGFSYNPQAYPPTEFQCLLKAIGWQTREGHLSIRNEFNACYKNIDCWAFYGRVSIPSGGMRSDKSHERPLNKGGREPVAATAAIENRQFDLSNPPLVIFFRRFEREISVWYSYNRKSPLVEFGRLSELVSKGMGFWAASDRWIETIPMHHLGPNYRLAFWKSEIYRGLRIQDQFYQAIEEQLDWFVDIKCHDSQNTGSHCLKKFSLIFQRITHWTASSLISYFILNQPVEACLCNIVHLSQSLPICCL